MRRRLLVSLALAAMVALGLSGCGKDEAPPEEVSGRTPTAVAVSPTVGTTQPTTAAGGAGASAQAPTTTPVAPSESGLDISPVDALNSYRSEMVMASTVDGTISESWSVMVEYVRDPEARHTLSTREDGTTFEMIQIGDDSYINSGDGEWMAMTTETSIMEGTFLGDAGISSEQYRDQNCEAKGTETANGYRSVHYVCDTDASSLGIAELTGTIQDVTSEVWLSEEYQVAVKSLYAYTVKGTDGKLTTTRIDTNVTMINEPITIEPPEGVAPAGAAADIPIMEGAKDTFSMAGMTSYTVEDKTPAEVETWYKEAMASAGWEYDESASSGGEMSRFSKAGRQVVVMFSASDDDTSVTIVEQTE